MPFLPDVIQLGPLPVATAGLTALAGGLTAYLLAGWNGRQHPAGTAEGAQDLVFHLALGWLAGAKLVYILMDPLPYLENPLQGDNSTGRNGRLLDRP